MSEEKPEWQRESIDLTSIDQLQARIVEAAEGRANRYYEMGKSYIDTHISGLEQTINARFDTMLSEIQRIDQRIDQLQARVERIERQLESSL
jgi:chaperonin cofactor prefoldin